MNDWYNYTEHRSSHTIVGTLMARDGVYSPQLHNRRRLYVYLPPSYAASQRRYPVIYMHDGQNLFDQTLSFAGEWQVDETMELLSGEGFEAIVVGVPNMGTRRLDEYSPFRDRRLRQGGRGDWYVSFLADTVKPLVDRDFRTLAGREHTGVLGSSMGGLISLYAFFRRPEAFGLAGAMSPSLWFAQEALFPYVEHAPIHPGKIYLDIGTHEGIDPRLPQRSPHKYVNRYAGAARRMRDLLAARGYAPGAALRYDEEEQGAHNEAAWARRLPDALRWLLAGERTPPDSAGAAEPAQPERWWEF
jgi:predicted alpha/beta superfamily hydrolase